MAEKTKRIHPLNNTVAPHWEYGTSDYPDEVKVPMEDGHAIKYVRFIEQPHPKCLKTIEMIQIMKKHTYGGGYKGKHVRKDQMSIFIGGKGE